MLLIHANYLDEDFRLVQGDIEIEDGKILRVGKDLPRKEEDLAVDCAGSYTVVPGFVDVHIHGCAGADTCDATREALEAMAAFLLAHGVTSFCPTTMTTSRETIQAALLAAKDMMDHPMEGGARVVGVNMEGPFIAKERKGAQKEEDILPPDFPLFQRFYEESGGIVRLVDVAPEQPGGLEFVEKASQLCTVSIAHTTADYDQAKAAFDKGVTHATHLFNAMSGLHHRKPGVVGAVFDDSRVRGELICDGFHIHPAVLRAAFRLLGDRALIVSDSMRANGMPEGEAFDLGGCVRSIRESTSARRCCPTAPSRAPSPTCTRKSKTWFPSACPLSRPSRRPLWFPPGPLAWMGKSAALPRASAPTWWCWMGTCSI